jgi:hypothetical protein
LVGDVEFKSVVKKAGYLTPVPGGVGPMTIAMLMDNIVLAWKRNMELPDNLEATGETERKTNMFPLENLRDSRNYHVL